MDFTTMLLIVLRPLLGLAFLAVAVLVGIVLMKRIPEGRVKRFLSKDMSSRASTPVQARNWWPTLIWFALFAAMVVGMGHH